MSQQQPGAFYQHNVDAMQCGLSTADIERETARISSIATTLRKAGDAGEVAAFTLPSTRADLPAIERLAERIRERFSHLVILGTGGSSLGAMMLCNLLRPRFVASAMQIHCVDNSDPHTIDALMNELPLADSFFLAISKSGGTTETMLTLLSIIQTLEQRSMPIADQLLAITMPGPRPLRQLAEHYRFRVLDHDPAIGGRFSILSLVGLLPAAVAGFSLERLRHGAQIVQDDFWNNPLHAAPSQGAVLHYLHMQAGRTISVLMPYCDRLDQLGSWYRQLWAESLGKQGLGSTPIRALGTVDQHSQLQLYLDGPRDKVMTMIRLEPTPTHHTIAPELAHNAGMEFLGGHDLSHIIDAQQRATAQSVRRASLPLREITLPNLNAESIGALCQHFMLETVMTAGLLGVNAFDQPAVEESKQLTRENLARLRDSQGDSPA